MYDIRIKIATGLNVDTPEGVVSFPPNEWVTMKPKYSQWPELTTLTDNAQAMGVSIQDQNEDVWACSELTAQESRAICVKAISFLARMN